jgi:hypothetical protein
MSDRPLLIEMIRTEARKYSDRTIKAGKFGHVPEKHPGKNLFTIHTASHWLVLNQNTPVPPMLFGEFWHQGELCILFADTNAGKSVLAVQIGNAIAGRHCMEPFGWAPQSNVVYIDFELSAKQFQARYTHNEVIYQFSDGFYRAEFNPAADMPLDFTDYDEYMNSVIEYAITATGATVVIIDNITCLRSGTEHASKALPLMRHLKALKTKHRLSILVLAHTPKRNAGVPISRNDLQGSKMLINFADSAFAIGISHQQEGSLRYLKQVKQRATQQVYGEGNVCLFRITKPLNFLQCTFQGNANESAHLYRASRRHSEEVYAQIRQLHAQGISQRKIAEKLNVGLATVNKVVNEA